MHMIQIVHISDFHLDSEIISSKKKELINALIEDLKKNKVDSSKCIFAISGDLIDKGGYQFSSIKKAFDLFKESFFFTR